MKDYTAIGTIVYNQRPDFKLFLGGVSKSLRASKHSIGAVYAREITKDEIHSRIQPKQSCGGANSQAPLERGLQHDMLRKAREHYDICFSGD